MSHLAFWIAAWAGTALGFTLTALVTTRRLHARSRAAAAQVTAWPKLLMVRPCEGLDPSLAATLRSSLRARYDGPRAIFFCVPSAHDPAYAVAAAVRDELVAAGGDVQLIVTELGQAANRKAAQLACVERQLPDDGAVLVVADSDVMLEDDSLPALVGALEADPEAAASSAPPIDVAPRTVGDRASAALLSSTPNALLALAALSEWAGSVPLLAGALLAIRRPALTAAGGFAALEPYLGEDFELARRLHAAGRRLATSAVPARFTDSGRSLGSVIRRYARWALVVRRQRPALFATYILLLGCAPLVTLATAVLAALDAPLAWLALLMTALLLAARALLAVSLRRCYGLGGSPARAMAAGIAGESLILTAAFLATASAEVEWRGHRFYVGERGALEPVCD
jgi:cellulose synthase/poly-beta-1,6-N-acetylglucosamine synthase-like glycosyltransferase